MSTRKNAPKMTAMMLMGRPMRPRENWVTVAL